MSSFMKKLFSGLLSSVFFLGLLAPAIPTHGASWTVIQFEIIAPATVKANEAFDITVRAVDSDKNPVSSYRGSIIFASAVFGDTVPLQGKAIQFTAEDNGEKTFYKATSFKDPGQKDISVVDLNNTDLSGETSVNVVPADSGNTNWTSEPITIISPENNSKITSDMVSVSGNTRKNSKVNIKLNGVVAGTASSDADGIFTKTISGITQQSSIISADVLDANGAIIGSSQEITVWKANVDASIYSVTVSPGTTVEASASITINIETSPDVSSVNVTIDGASLAAKAKEGADKGKFSLDTVAPSKEGTYSISVSVTNSMGVANTKDKAVELVVTPAPEAPSPTFKNVQAVTGSGGRVTFTFGLDNPPVDLNKFQIAYGDTPDGFGSGVTTYETGKIIGSDGLYHWYIPGLESKTYYFKILAMKTDGTVIGGVSSDPINATVGKDGCTIGNVGTISIQTLSGKSILSWDQVSNAVSYNIYKVSAAGDQTLFQNVKENQYTLYLASGAVTYDDFVIKALCDEKTESSVPAVASRVPTGPASIAFIVIISGILGAIILRRKAL